MSPERRALIYREIREFRLNNRMTEHECYVNIQNWETMPEHAIQEWHNRFFVIVDVQLTPKFNKGDKVKIIKYGSIIWINKKSPKPNNAVIIYENEDFWHIDIMPEIVGQIGIVTDVVNRQNKVTYAINGPNKHAWYHEEQLELITKTP